MYVVYDNLDHPRMLSGKCKGFAGQLQKITPSIHKVCRHLLWCPSDGVNNDPDLVNIH